MHLARRQAPIPLRNIKITDKFWGEWQRTVRDKSLPLQFKQLVETGRLANFKRAAGKEPGEFEGTYYNDSDVYKWLEACAYAFLLGPHPELQAMVDEAIEAIESAQEDSGYLSTYFQLSHPDLKWRNLAMLHEMYCGGHLIEAAVAFAECTDDKRLLAVAVKYADHLIEMFGPNGRRGYCGHQEIELALVRLSSETRDPRYRDLARRMIEERGKRPTVLEAELNDEEAMKLSPWAQGLLKKDGKYSGEYLQDHAPIREHTEIVGHAVRAMYYYMAATDLADDQNDAAMEAALEKIWNNLTRKRMYVTGGIGPSSSNEGFTGDYDLPNLTAYAETCAACGLAMWGRRLLNLTGSSEFADIVEKALYNGAISGISTGGDLYFYTNPLESRKNHQRVPWFRCACCPPNLARTIGSVANYVAGASDDAFWLNIPAGLEAEVSIAGVRVNVSVQSNYPWSGAFTVEVNPERPVEFEVRVRIPHWADEIQTELQGLKEEAQYESGYAIFKKVWQKGDSLKVDFEMAAQWVEADPRVSDDLGRVALTRGPLVYCAESTDLGFAPQLFAADTDAEVVEQPGYSGAVALTVEGTKDREEFVDDLYARTNTIQADAASASFIPYYLWANRGPSYMQVWTRRL